MESVPTHLSRVKEPESPHAHPHPKHVKQRYNPTAQPAVDCPQLKEDDQATLHALQWNGFPAHGPLDAATSIELQPGATPTLLPGDMDSQYTFAMHLLRGKGVAQNLSRCVEVLRGAAAAGHDKSLYKLGLLIEAGLISTNDPADAHLYYEFAAVKGLAPAQYKLALHLLCVAESHPAHFAPAQAEARIWLKCAASQGHARAHTQLRLIDLNSDNTKDSAYSRLTSWWLDVVVAEGVKEALLTLAKQCACDPNRTLQAESVALMKRAAFRRHPKAMYRVGYWYFNGMHGPKRPDIGVSYFNEAIKCGSREAECGLAVYQLRDAHARGVAPPPAALPQLESLARRGHSQALVELAMLYRESVCVPTDPSKHAAMLKMAAFQGHTDAKYFLGMALKDGFGMAPDPTGAHMYLDEAAKEGHILAQHALAQCKEQGVGTLKSPKQAVHWYSRAAAQHHAASNYRLGQMYEQGIGVVKNEVNAFECYRQAHIDGHVPAIFDVGRCLLYGVGCTGCYEEGLWLIQAAVEGRDVRAMRELASIHMKAGTSQEPEAVTLYHQAALLGDLESRVELAVCLLEGKGIQKDVNRAFKMFVETARDGSTRASQKRDMCICDPDKHGITNIQDYSFEDECDTKSMMSTTSSLAGTSTTTNSCSTRLFRVGMRFLDGDGVLPDATRGVSYLKRAAKAGHAGAQYWYGFQMEHGRGTKQNLKAATNMYNQAAQSGHVEAKYRLARCFDRGIGISIDHVVAYSHYFALVHSMHHVPAMVDLAMMYWHGRGIPRDRARAMTLLHQAVEEGDPNAMRQLIMLKGRRMPTHAQEQVSWV
eukprot:m.67740 g.67740  ORF g.67740 m.67740 type:complete len:820 (+) comp12169_c0_seq5:395-2854(+)